MYSDPTEMPGEAVLTSVMNNTTAETDFDAAAERAPWARLEDTERLVLAPKLTPVVNPGAPTESELDDAGKVFNELMDRNHQSGETPEGVTLEASQVSERIVAVQNFVDMSGGHAGKESPVWRQIDRIDNVWETGMVEVVVRDRTAFRQALQSEGYLISAPWDLGPHDNDSARQLTDTSWDPALHFANDDSKRLRTYWAHVDQRSVNFRRTTYARKWREMFDAARSHNKPSIPSRIRQHLKEKRLVSNHEH